LFQNYAIHATNWKDPQGQHVCIATYVHIFCKKISRGTGEMTESVFEAIICTPNIFASL